MSTDILDFGEEEALSQFLLIKKLEEIKNGQKDKVVDVKFLNDFLQRHFKQLAKIEPEALDFEKDQKGSEGKILKKLREIMESSKPKPV